GDGKRRAPFHLARGNPLRTRGEADDICRSAARAALRRRKVERRVHSRRKQADRDAITPLSGDAASFVANLTPLTKAIASGGGFCSDCAVSCCQRFRDLGFAPSPSRGKTTNRMGLVLEFTKLQPAHPTLALPL